jgi:hypothetical protein
MTGISRDGETFVVDAPLLAAALDLPQEAVRAGLRDGRITTRCEAGTDADAGRWRLTFYHGGRACRFVVDAEGKILSRARFPAPDRAGPGGG